MFSNEILFKDVKPGMLIQGHRHFGLIAAIHQEGNLGAIFEGKPYLEMYDAQDVYYGSSLSTFFPEEMVTVISGEEREIIIKKILKDLELRSNDIRKDLVRVEALLDAQD